MQSRTREPQTDKPVESYDFEPPVRPPEVADDLKRLLGLVAGRRRPGEEFMTTVKKIILSDEPELGTVVPLFDRTVWGHVRWDRSVGRPKAARMADAFTFEHWYHVIKDGGVDAEGNVIDISEWRPATIARVWDGPHDEQYYRVSYMLYGQYPWKNALGVTLRLNTEWEPRTPPWLGTVRTIAYPTTLTSGMFDVKKTGITELDDIEVVRRLQ